MPEEELGLLARKQAVDATKNACLYQGRKVRAAYDTVGQAACYLVLAEIVTGGVQMKVDLLQHPLVNALVALPLLVSLIDELGYYYNSLFGLGKAKVRRYFAERELRLYERKISSSHQQD